MGKKKKKGRKGEKVIMIPYEDVRFLWVFFPFQLGKVQINFLWN